MSIEQIIKIKFNFDNNLPADYTKIKPDSGMCGYWSLVYYYLFSKYGLECNIVNIIVNDEDYFHVITRVYADKDSYVDLDRRSCVAGDGHGTSSLIDDWEIYIHREIGVMAELKLEDKPELYKIQRNSLIYVGKETLGYLFRYVDNFIEGNREEKYPRLINELSKSRYLDLTLPSQQYLSIRSKVYGTIFRGQRKLLRILGIKNR